MELLRRDATRVDLRSKRALGQLRTVLMNCMQKKAEQRAREDGQWTDEVPDSLRDDLMN